MGGSFSSQRSLCGCHADCLHSIRVSIRTPCERLCQLPARASRHPHGANADGRCRTRILREIRRLALCYGSRINCESSIYPHVGIDAAGPDMATTDIGHVSLLVSFTACTSPYSSLCRGERPERP